MKDVVFIRQRFINIFAFLNVTLFDNGGVVKCVWWSFGKFTGKKPVFNGSEVYLEASQTSTNKFYCE